MIRISNVKIYEDLSKENIFKKVISKYRINNSNIIEWCIAKKSIDARKKDDIHYNFSIDLKLKNEEYYIRKYKNISKIKENSIPNIDVTIPLTTKPVIIGAGPARIICSPHFDSKWYKTYNNRARRKRWK